LINLFYNREFFQKIKSDDWYIVVFKEDVSATRQLEIKQLTLKYHPLHNISYEYSIIPGFAAHLTLEGVAYLHTLEEIDYIEEDKLVFAYQSCTTQESAGWNLARVSTRGGPQFGASTYKYNNDGRGVTCYVLDTGILLTHEEFAPGRAVWGANFAEPGDTDRNGHGTHVASVIAGKTLGIAKGVKVVAVKVLYTSGSGSIQSVIAGLEWVAARAIRNKDIINISFGSSPSLPFDQACSKLVDLGIFLSVAAGNSNNDACSGSPGRVPTVFAVGATEQTFDRQPSDYKASYSSWGPCVHSFAPGQYILGAWRTNDSDVRVISGTSTSSAHVSGIASLILSRESRSPSSTKDEIIRIANKNTVLNPGNGSPNVMIWSGCSS